MDWRCFGGFIFLFLLYKVFGIYMVIERRLLGMGSCWLVFGFIGLRMVIIGLGHVGFLVRLKLVMCAVL